MKGKISNFSIEKYSDFKSDIKQILNSLTNLKFVEHTDEIKDLLNLTKEKERDLFYEYLFFTNYSKISTQNIDWTLYNTKIIDDLDKLKIYNDSNGFSKNSFQLVFHMYLYLLIHIEKNINLLILYQNTDQVENKKKEINQLYHLLSQILIMTFKHYKEKIYSLNQILILVDSITVFVNKYSINEDKYINLKNIILFDLLFEILGNIAKIILNNKPVNKDVLSLFFKYLIKYIQSDNLQTYFNCLILSRCEGIHKLMSIILNNIDYNECIDIYNKHKNAIINFFANIYKNNATFSNFFEKLINQNKTSFSNLMNYKTKKDSIISDIYLQNLYIEILNILIYNENSPIPQKIKKSPKNPPENSFRFNGFNSKIIFQLNKFSLENAILLSSFQLSSEVIKDSSESYYPLFIFQSISPNDTVIKIYIQKENNAYKLKLCHEKKNEKTKILNFDRLQNISPNNNYFISIKFIGKKIILYLYLKENAKNFFFYQDGELYDYTFHSALLKLGYDDQNNKYYKGFIGSIAVIQNMKMKKNSEYENLVGNILNLNNYYKLFPYMINKSAEYNFKNYFYFTKAETENKVKLLIDSIINSIEEFQCIFYLTPEILNTYYTLNKNIIGFPLPQIPNISNNETIHIFNEINVYVTNIHSIITEFQKNNGFDYLTLIYEYYYQLFILMGTTKENEFDINLKNKVVEKIIVTSFYALSSILMNFKDSKIITNNIKSFKTLFRNIFETLKAISKISINTFQQMVKSINNLILEYKRDISLPFVDGLIDMIFDSEIYENYEDDRYITILISLITNYLSDTGKTKNLPFKPDFIYKLLNLVKIIEKFLKKDDNKYKNLIIDSFLGLLGLFFKSIINEENSSNYFRQLIPFSVIEYENNLFITYKFLHFINEMSFNKYSIDKFEDLELLQDYQEKLIPSEKEPQNNVLIDEINLEISCIMIKSYLFHIEDKSNINIDAVTHFFKTEKSFSIIVNELTNIISTLFKSGVNGFNISIPDKKKDFYYSELFENIFKFIILLFQSVVLGHFDDKEEDDESEKKENSTKNKFDFLSKLLTNIKEQLKKHCKEKSIYFYCLINYVKFFHYIIFNEIKIFQLLNKKSFVQQLLQIIQICSESYLSNYNQLFKVEKDNKEEKKTIIEIVFEICMEYILNENSSNDCFKILFEKFDEIFYDDKFKVGPKRSVFYVNDYLRYLSTQKKVKEKTESILKRSNIINENNIKVFKTEKKFDLNFSTYFLSKIIDYQKLIEENKNLSQVLSSILLKFMENLFSAVLKEHKELYSLDKKYFFKTSSFSDYNEKINYLKDKYVKKDISPDNVRKSLLSISEKNKQNKNVENKEEINNNENLTELKLERKATITRRTISQTDMKVSRLQKRDKKNEVVFDNSKFTFPSDINKIKFFYDLDEKYVYNIKKDLMNNIFGLFYIDEFFYNSDFCIMKKFYINKMMTGKMVKNSKQINFPTILKNYKNNFESNIFLKQFNNYFTDLFLPITHDYVDKYLNDKISRKKSIKLKQKDLPQFIGDKKIECEILKNETSFYGKLIYNENGNYLMFKEESRTYDEEDKEFRYLFLIDYFWYFNYLKKTQTKKFRERTKKKNIIFLFDNIEEIIEMRILLLWKGFEIYLKNGKSYLFNFLSTKDYDDFIKDFLMKTKLKNVFRRRDFLNEKSTIYDGWIKSFISNYDYLLLLNRYSSRSYNDPTQYYIFPWLLKIYKTLEFFNSNESSFNESLNDEPNQESLHQNQNQDSEDKDDPPPNPELIKQLIEKKKLKAQERNKSVNEDYYKTLKEIKKRAKHFLRMFNFPISLQTKNKRDTARKKFNEDKEDGIKFPKHSGCHYSNSAYIYFYLMRQQPYDNLIVRLQEYCQENTNRCFINLTTLESLARGGNDNRELIPEFFFKIEYFLNINCDFYGILDVKKVNLDDCEVDIFDTKDSSYLSTYIYFILQQRKLINSKTIGYYLNKWIDNVFGINQIPSEKNQFESCNLFSKYTYEQKINLEKKLEKNKAKDLTTKQIANKLKLCVSQLINFGVTPTQLFKYPHGELKIYRTENIKENDEKDDSCEDDLDILDVEGVVGIITKESVDRELRSSDIPKYFFINPTINKIFIYTQKEEIIIFDCKLFNEINMNYSEMSEFNYRPENLHIFANQENSIYQIKYGFSSFNKNIKYKSNDSKDEIKSEFHTYYYDKINYLINRKNILTPKNKNENFFMLTCRHLDSSFQIHYLKYYDKKKKKKELPQNVFSFFCEDFISSCCCTSSDNFILGLINGKLIEYKMQIDIYQMTDKKKKVELIEKISIKLLKYIQAHRGKINSIDIDKRLGIVITSGDDNYIFVRKLFDFELLLPIKIKNKFKILMTKVSPFNFLYVLCFNKLNNKNIIFGYTFSGIRFAKSEYGLYDNISINEDGNIMTNLEKKEMIILSGSELTRLNQLDDDNFSDFLNKTKIYNWSQYDCFNRKDEEDMRKIVSYLCKEKEKYFFKTQSLLEL